MEAEIQACEQALESLRIQYEQYFARILRRPPVEEEERLARRIEGLRTSPQARGVFRFRVETLYHRLSSYRRMWARTVREMEEGTYIRDLARLRRRAEAKAAAPPAVGPKFAGAPGAQISSGPDETRLRRLYDAWIAARERCEPGASHPSFEQVAASIRKQVPVLMERYKARSIDFQVVIQNGKAVLKAVPRS